MDPDDLQIGDDVDTPSIPPIVTTDEVPAQNKTPKKAPRKTEKRAHPKQTLLTGGKKRAVGPRKKRAESVDPDPPTTFDEDSMPASMSSPQPTKRRADDNAEDIVGEIDEPLPSIPEATPPPVHKHQRPFFLSRLNVHNTDNEGAAPPPKAREKMRPSAGFHALRV